MKKKLIKKIYNKKYCILSLFLAALLFFAVFGATNSSKNKKNEVNAITQLTTKNLDLNGIRYTYQTSLNELKNKYGIFKEYIDFNFFNIAVSTESEVQIQYYGVNTKDFTEERKNNLIDLTNNSITFEINNIKIPTNSKYYDIENEGPNKILDFDNLNSLDNITGININLSNYIEEKELFTGLPYANFPNIFLSIIYTKNDLDPLKLEDKEYIKQNSIYKAYVTSSPINYFYKIEKIENYSVRHITLNYSDGNASDKNKMVTNIPDSYFNLSSSNNPFAEMAIYINNLQSIYNTLTNIIKIDYDFSYDLGIELAFKGNLLLSNYNYDKKLLEYLQQPSIPSKTVIQNLGATVYFGGDFEDRPNKISTNQIKYIQVLTGKFGMGSPILFENYHPDNFIFYFGEEGPGLPVDYSYQCQLITVNRIVPLTINEMPGGYQGEGLSAQVEDILYNVNYEGNVLEIQREEKVKEDATNLLITGGLGAVLGAIVGFLIGNPIGGLIVGGIGGLIVGIGPLLIDGLQAIFGDNFATGLYNFFKSITKFFVNIVDNIFNFIFSIITNPFVLIFILIVVILYFFVYKKKV